jgi:hypothetical protein
VLRFLLDEHLRGPLWLAIMRHNSRGELPIDVIRVGDTADLPLGSSDLAILLWAAREVRILITEDRRTIAVHLAQHTKGNHNSPGVFIVRIGFSIGQLVSHLELVAHAGKPTDYEDGITYIP